jgi:hypothetical protein
MKKYIYFFRMMSELNRKKYFHFDQPHQNMFVYIPLL